MKSKTTTRKRISNVRAAAIRNGYRSGLEDSISAFFSSNAISFQYEDVKIDYTIPVTKHRYTPDFLLNNGIFIETKGRFVATDRKKHLLIKEQHPELDIRFVFQNPNNKITKQSKTTYADWCNKHGFKFCSRDELDVILLWTKE